jgi:Amt family ammonium transporter
MAVDPNAIAHIAITTNTAGAFGGVAATITAWLYLGKPDLSMIINGILAGLVGITAGCAWINVPNSAIIGTIAGICRRDDRAAEYDFLDGTQSYAGYPRFCFRGG